MHVEYLFLRPGYDLDDRIKRVPMRKLESGMAIAHRREGNNTQTRLICEF